jgi:outer membrane protein assembly factor BamA
MKIAFSTEFRFKLLGDLKGALFADAGNIWNVSDVTDPKSTFTGLSSLKDCPRLRIWIAIRFNLLVVRFDFGFKTYDPANEIGKKWFRQYNFANSVLNFGINYPNAN